MIIGIGTDIVKINRIRLKYDENYRYLGPKEKKIYKKLEKDERKKEFLAGRWAAKEALYKAFNIEGMQFSTFDVYYVDNKPTVDIAGYSIFISIAHEKEYALAYAIVKLKNSK